MSVNTSENNQMRFDLQMIASWIDPNTKVLDLGCGEGELLYHLKHKKNVIGTGIEHDETYVAKCIEKGLSVLQGDINEEINDYPDQAFDFVILSRTLQQVYEPSKLIGELLRIGRKGIVSFPNFSHWAARLQLLLTGHAPVTKRLPFQWYNTPNIRVITIKDFRRYSQEMGFHILKELNINLRNQYKGQTIQFLPTLRASYGMFLISKERN
jgi:methionine biosynthesis protein MetW